TDTTRQPVTVRARLKILCTKDGLPETVADLIDRLISKSEYLVRACKEASECGYTIHRIGKNDVDGAVVRTKESARLAREARSKDREIRGKICTSCGMDNHEAADCRLKHHPHANKSAKPFKESFHGLRYFAAGKKQLKYAEDENGDAIAMGTAPPPRLKTDKKKKWAKKGAVMGNYCSVTVGNWIRAKHADCWQDIDSGEELCRRLAMRRGNCLTYRSSPPNLQDNEHVSEMLQFGNEEYGMIGDDSNLFPDKSNPLGIADILASIRMDGTATLQTALRALVTEFADIFSNDIGGG
ncbi:hypothetical protein B484DRAFT_409100, partial [Ochromonadaceae sp. CCMP2298]